MKSVEHFADMVRHSDGIGEHFTGMVRHSGGLGAHFADIVRHSDGIGEHFAGMVRHSDGLGEHFAGLVRHSEEPIEYFAGILHHVQCRQKFLSKSKNQKIEDYESRVISSLADTSCCVPVSIFLTVILFSAISLSPAKATNGMCLALA